MKILNLGSLNIDKTYQVEHFVKPKETLDAAEYQEFCGGKGLNQSVALAKAGANVYHAGMIGMEGCTLLEVMKMAGVKIELVETVNTPTGHAIIQVDKEGQNSILIFGGANQKVTREYIDYALRVLEKGELLLLQNEVSNIEYAIEKASEAGIKIALNPSPFNEKILKCDLAKVDYFILNEIEGKELAEADSFEPNEIIEKLRKKYPHACFVVTFGENGSYYADAEKVLHQQIFKVPVCDTTGAGDTFCGYFLAGIMKGIKVEENLRRASAASAIAVSRRGAADGIPDEKDVESFLKGSLSS